MMFGNYSSVPLAAAAQLFLRSWLLAVLLSVHCLAFQLSSASVLLHLLASCRIDTPALALGVGRALTSIWAFFFGSWS
jgi:hypothetical protein